MKEITVQELKQLREENRSFQLIDIRESWEVTVCSIGGEHIPMGEIITRISELKPDVRIIIHCRSGGRSANVVSALELQRGLTNLYSLKGGILAWADEIDPSLEKY